MNDLVKQWQRALLANGYEPGTADGVFGRQTLTASMKALNGDVGGNGLSSTLVDPRLIEDLKRDEGLRLHAYPDPLSGGDPWTIGYGATGPGIRKGTVWTQEQAEKRLTEMALDHGLRLEKELPWVAKLDPVRRRVLWNMAYNLGVQRLLGFKNTLEYVRTGQYDKASSGMLASKWAKQVGQRAVRLALQMKTG